MLADHYYSQPAFPACTVLLCQNSCGEQEGEKEVNMRHFGVSCEMIRRNTREVVGISKDKQIYRRQVQ